MNRRFTINKQYLQFMVLFYFLIFENWLEQYWSFVGYGDEIIALLAIPIFIVKLVKSNFVIKETNGYARYIIVFCASGLLGSLFYKYQRFVEVAMPDMFLCLKFWFAIYVGKNILPGFSIAKYAKKIYKHIIFIISIYIICCLCDLTFHVFKASIRYGIRSTQLMYSQPTVLVACCVFLIGLLLAVSEYNPGWKKWLGVLLFLVCSTLRIKAWGAVIAIVLICYFVLYRKKKITLKMLLLFIPVLVALAWNQIYYYFFSAIQEDSARYQLLVKSIEIMKDHFPIGAGFGTYASYYSGKYYSPLYFSYGLSGVHGLQIYNKSFMTDSFWPMVLGETGFIGAIAFACTLLKLFRQIQTVRITSKAFYASAVCMLSYLLISSMAESAFVNPVAIPLATLIGITLNQRKSNNNIKISKKSKSTLYHKTR